MIFYFSGTGNTRWAAEAVARALGEPLIAIADAADGDCHYSLSAGERIGIFFPVHGWRPPHIVRRFIRRLHIADAEGHYCYALATCGDSVGRAMQLLRDDLAVAGIRLDSTFSLIMPESYVALPFMYTDSPERERQKKAQARADLDRYLPHITNRDTCLELLHRGYAPWIYTFVIGAYFNARLITDRPFVVDPERCVGCRKCETVCPVKNVVNGADDSKRFLPAWLHDGRCTTCLACYHYCPHHAIDYRKAITKNRGQYYFKE